MIGIDTGGKLMLSYYAWRNSIKYIVDKGVNVAPYCILK
jgi:hypothetical protein